MTPVELQSALRNGDPVFGTLIVSPSAFWPKVIGDCGLDFVFIDTEHIALDRERVSWMCRTYGALGLPPLVRIPDQDPDTATMLLDDGAAGIVVPYVEKPETVSAMRGATKLRPLKGKRRDAALAGGDVEPELADYIAKSTENNLLIINIESVPAMEALDEILAEEGPDAILIGPHDLSSSLGIAEQYDDTKFLKACETILNKARAAGVGAGIHHWLEPEKQAAFIDMGANMLIHKADIIFFRLGIQKELREIRELSGLNKDTDTEGGEISI